MRIIIIIISKFLLLLLCHNLIIRSVSAKPAHDHAVRPQLNSSYGEGKVEELGALRAYVSGSVQSKRAVVLISDVFGFEVPKLRKIGDEMAKEGFYAVVPDFFRGEPYDPTNRARPMKAWLKDHTPENGYENAKILIEALKGKGLKSIGAAGFCWGGKVAVELSKSTAYVQAQTLSHPTYISVDDMKGVMVATLILEEEKRIKLMQQFEEALKAKPEIDSSVKIFRGVKHGWTTRYNDGDVLTMRSAEMAHGFMIDWFNKHLK